MVRPKLPRDFKPAALTTRPVAQVRRGLTAVSAYLSRFSARHHGLALGTACAVVAAVAFLGEVGGDGAAASQMQTKVLDVPAPEPIALPFDDAEAELEVDAWTRVEVRPGQTLAAIFAAQGLSPRDVHNVVHLDEHTKKLTRIFPGDELAFRFTAEGELQELQYQLDEATRLRVLATGEGLSSELIAENLVRQLRETSGTITGSFFFAGRQAGLTDAMILELARLFGWDIDFILDIRAGDSFHVIYDEVFRDGEFLRAGDIIAATFVNQGERYQAVRYENADGIGYFSPDGRNMKKAFLRAPLNFSRISSHFNPKRFHPILKRVKAHRGIDYAAPPGTPVQAAGDGRVVRSGYDNANGHHVFIEHPNGVTTKYLHFTRRTVKKGQRVSQGTTIGFVGMTGMATAPHLHYEFIVNGVHRNPATVDLPKAEPLPPGELATFTETARPLLAQLERMAANQMLATATE
ncbi:MAG: peptidoglycan DD-metalloendopeptidase family protein [Pseudomonadota bacterium]